MRKDKEKYTTKQFSTTEIAEMVTSMTYFVYMQYAKMLQGYIGLFQGIYKLHL